MSETVSTPPTIRSDSTLLLDTIEENKANMTDRMYKESLEALGRMQAIPHTCPRHSASPVPVVFVNDRIGSSELPFKIEKSVIYTASPLDYPTATLEFTTNVDDDEDSGLHVLFTSTSRVS